jgi:Ca-activated chloride channel family protein
MGALSEGAFAVILLHPFMLCLGLLALVPWIGPWAGTNTLQKILRSVVFILLAIALATPYLDVEQGTPCKVLILDRSASVSEAGKSRALTQMAEFQKSPDAHLVAFGDTLGGEDVSGFSSVTIIEDHLTRGETPLSSAIAMAQTLIPLGSHGSVTVASDANATRPDDDRAIAALRRQKIPVHWAQLETATRPATPVGVHWSTPLRKGAESTIDVRLVIPSGGGNGTLVLKSGDTELARANFAGDGLQEVPLEFEPLDAGFLDAVVVAQTDGGVERELPVVLPILPPHQLLYLGERQTDAAEKLAGMLGPSFEVSTVETNDAEQLEEALDRTDLVLLDDQPAERVNPVAEQQLVKSVQNDGLGLVMSGGRASFGGGGWHDRPIETLLPIELVQKEEKRDPSTSLVIVIDTSGSMSGVRVQLAKEVSRLAMKRLLPHDKVGIVEFYGAKRWAAPLQPASNAIELQRALNRMDAGGGTVILPALEEAFYGLQNVDTRYKHVLVLTDGGVESGDFESLMRRMSSEGINVSTVLAGGGYHSEFLVNIANWGKGRFYNVPNRFNLPEILLKQPSTTKLPSYRPGEHVVQARGGPGWWGDVDTAQLPPLAGYVESKPRTGSEVLLETVAEQHPVLATWRYGLGRVTTLTTEPLGEGTTPWQKWDDYGNALARILQRSTADTREPFQFHSEFDGGEVLIHAVRQQPRGVAALDATPLARFFQSKEPVVFQRRSPDRYVARMPIPPRGQTLRMETSATSTPERWKLMAVMSPVASEGFVDPANSLDTETLITLTGGQRMSPTSIWLDAPVSQVKGKMLLSLAPWLYASALLLFIVEIILRRLPRRSKRVPDALRRSVIAGLLVVMFPVASAFGQEKPGESVIAAASKLIDEGVSKGVNDDAVAEFFNTAILNEGNLQTTLDWLARSTDDLTVPRNQVIAEIEVKLAARRGDLQRASDLLMDLLKQQGIAESRLDLRLIQAKFHDALGEVEAAKEIYTELTKSALSEADRQTVSLRLALMGLLGDSKAKQASDAKPLIELASKSDDTGFRNRAANVLAVQNRHADALKLFTITGTGTARFRSASRVTEWAIRAKERDRAIETAWQAVEAAALKRDRNYALALLVEAYRLQKKTAGVEALVVEFKRRNDSSEPMTAEMQRVWIDLLRELGRYEDAIALFRKTNDSASGFTVEMRRELLELEGEAGNIEQMIATYRQLIQSEPDELAWRGGLTQILLERGDKEQAIALWDGYVTQTERGTTLMNSALTLGELGLDRLASKAVERMVELRASHGQALLYWADLQQRRGDVEGAEVTLNRVQSLEDVGDEVRAELASAYERIGRQDKAIEVNEAIRETREIVAEDLEMRLAWLYSEVGDEDKALEQWLELWRKITSIPRRRYVEDRLMTVASRLGTLADIAIEIEEKLSDGTADAREAGLLVRIYSRVNDSVAATEISEEYMSQTGKDVVEQLQEKGRIYQICNDYWNYEKVIEQLIEVDPEGETEYLRQLALSMLERGKAQDARKVLMNLRTADDGKDSIGGEFEAGVLSLVGMKEEAADAYRQAIATHPDRIESYLLLANLLKANNQTDRAVGMFQYLAENAERDDMFTIAIDGLLNMEAKGRNMQWARRITLERLAGREDKNYLYQLLSDLSAEVNDKAGQIRAMENSLAVSGSRRLSVLRECMELSSNIRGGVYYSSSSRGPTNKGNLPFFAFGRRLIGLNELMPPQVFLDLGKAFLDDGDTQSAERTFGMARNLADPRSYQREVAEIFEKAGKIPEALARYDRLLRTSPSDVPLMARVAKLNESERKDAIAFRFYQGGLNLLLSQTPLTTREAAKNSQTSYWSNNRDAYQTYSDELLMGMLVTVPDEAIEQMLGEQRERLVADLGQLAKLQADEGIATELSEAPRIEKRFKQLQRMYIAVSQLDPIEEIDTMLLKRFPEDQTLFASIVNLRLNAGRRDSLQRLLESPGLSDTQQLRINSMLGKVKPEPGNTVLSPTAMWKGLRPAWLAGDREQSLQWLRRLNQKSVSGRGGAPSYVIVNGRAVMQERSGLGDVRIWMKLAVALGDDGLALQLARANISRQSFQTQDGFYRMCREILPKARFSELVRYATNYQQQKPERLANYLWLLSEMSDDVEDLRPNDGELLNLIQKGSLRLGYSFPFPVAMKVFPESIRADAFAEILDTVTPKILPQELIRVPFSYKEPIDAETQKVLLAAMDAGIDAALQDNYLRYCSYYMPTSGNVLDSADNQELAIKMLDLLIADKVMKRDANVAKIAQIVKAMLLFQGGQKKEGIALAFKTGSPFETASDSNLRTRRTWAFREFLTNDAETFWEALQVMEPKKELSIADYDKRFALLSRLRATDATAGLYAEAAKKYPKEAKFTSPAKRSSTRPRNVYQDIEMQAKRLDALLKKKDVSDVAKHIKEQDVIRTRLSSLWNSVEHRVNAMEHWSVVDTHDREAFEKAQKEKEAKENANAKGANKPVEPERDRKNVANVGEASDAANRVGKKSGSVKSPVVAGGVRSKGSAAVGTSSPTKPTQGNVTAQVSKNKAAKKPEKKYTKGVLGVKEAMDAGDEAGVIRGIRSMWRILPPVSSSPYQSRVVRRPLNILWPASKSVSPTTGKESEESKREVARKSADAAEKARQTKRGGLSTFVPPVRSASVPRTSAWDVLAERAYALPEMNRIVRSSFLSPAAAKPVSLGLLHAERLAKGDKVVLAGLVNDIREGRGSQTVLDGFFKLVSEKPELIDASNQGILDVLTDQLGIKNGSEAQLLAPLYAQVGDLKTAAMLYRVSAFFPSKNSNYFSALVSEAEQFYEGDELLELVESMFNTVYDRRVALPSVLRVRSELQSAQEAAEAARRDLPVEAALHDNYDVETLIVAANVFAADGDYKRAAGCVDSLLRRHGKPFEPRLVNASQYYVNRSRGRPWKLTRQNFLDLFDNVGDAERDNSLGWLTEAGKVVGALRAVESIDQAGVGEALLTIAYRQAEAGDMEAARLTLDMVDDELLKSTGNLDLVLVDLCRDAGLISRAVRLQAALQQEGNLPYVRFGEFVRDTESISGAEKAMKLFEQLVMLSLSSDLLVAGKDVAGENAVFLTRVADHEAEKVAADAEYQRRLTAAADRRAVAQKAAGKKSEVQTDEKTGSPKALPLSPAMKLRALPIQRGTKGP